MENIKFRNLRENEIFCKVKSIKADPNNGAPVCSLILYKDARVDQNILDETVGPERWQAVYEDKCGQLFCKLSIKTEDGQWISKEDTGADNNSFEKEKAKASDALKRAGFLWGIGRALYTNPGINFYLNPYEFEPGNEIGKFRLRFGVTFFVKHIGYSEDETKITELEIVDRFGYTRFLYPVPENN